VMGLCLLSDISVCTGLGTCHIALERKGQHSLSHSLTLPVLSLFLILWLSVLFTPLLFLYLSLSLSLSPLSSHLSSYHTDPYWPDSATAGSGHSAAAEGR